MLCCHRLAAHLEGKRSYNKFQEHDFLRYLKFPPFLPCYVAAEKRARISNLLKNRVLESCFNIFFTLVALNVCAESVMCWTLNSVIRFNSSWDHQKRPEIIVYNVHLFIQFEKYIKSRYFKFLIVMSSMVLMPSLSMTWIWKLGRLMTSLLWTSRTQDFMRS